MRVPRAGLNRLSWPRDCNTGRQEVRAVPGCKGASRAGGGNRQPRAAEGLAQDPAAIEANYVRRSDAELLYT